MSYELLRQCRGARGVDGQPIKGTALAMLLTLASYANDNNECWPSARTLAQDLNIIERNVRAWTKRLQLVGVLRIVGIAFRGTNRYRIEIQPLSDSTPVGSDTRQSEPLSKSVSTPVETRTQPLSDSTAEHPMNNQRTSTSFRVADLKNGCAGIFPIRGRCRGRLGRTPSWTLPAGKLSEWADTWPNVDIEAELIKARQWLDDNPNRRKTANGMLRFLSGWISRAVEHGTAVPRSALDSLPGANIESPEDLRRLLGDDTDEG